MSRVLLVDVELELGAALQLGVEAELVPVTSQAPVTSWLDLADRPTDALVIGEAAAAPLELAQRAHEIDPFVSVVVLCSPERRPRLREQLLFTPFLGSVALASTAGGPQLSQEVRRAVRSSTARRRHSRRLVHAGAAPPPGPTWNARPDELLGPLLQLAPIGVVLTDADGRVREWNQRAEALFGCARAEALDRPLHELVGVAPRVLERARSAEPLCLRRDPPLHVRLERAPLDVEEGGRGSLVLVQDVTAAVEAEAARRRHDEELARAQRLESLGTLAGGIAHDFNNLLTVVAGSAELALRRLEAQDPARGLIENIVAASDRAAELTGAMLTYAGRDPAVIEPLELNGLIQELTTLLAASLPKQVEVELVLAPGPLTVAGDRRQLHQVLMNLIVNAGDAIGDRPGRVRVRTARAPEAAELEGGAAVRVEVADDGCGIPPEVQERVFEPFFSTKATGRGLGLAAVQGIMRAHGGAIACESEPGRGTTFRVWLPAASERAPVAASHPAEPTGGEGLILVVDDEPLVRNISVEVLRQAGYDVLTADDGVECLEVLEAEAERLRLVVLDMCMPRLSGRQTFGQLRRRWPELPVLLCSGYVGERVQDLVEQGPTRFIGKPYSMREFLAAVGQLVAG